MADDEWLRALGARWSMIENITDHADFLIDDSPLADAERPVHAMMTDDEIDAWSRLPNIVDLYRGCLKGINEYGICYSLDRNVAEGFCRRALCRSDESDLVLLHCQAQKNDIIAVKLCRSEQEIIVDKCMIIDDLFGNFNYGMDE
tara:strand:+ start:4490 stop:4924 length:435 start_codon:yes stop_codon:yes gene_type:complete